MFWNQYFAKPRDPAAVRQTARELMKRKKFDQVIAMIEAALRHGQPQPWMYESLGIAMELDGRSKAEIERVVMSAADFATSPDELMYIASYLSRTRARSPGAAALPAGGQDSAAAARGLCPGPAFGRAVRRSGRHSSGRRSAFSARPGRRTKRRSKRRPTQLANATLARLEKEGRDDELAAYRARLDAATVRDCVVQVSWTGDADVDFEVEEPTGTICSLGEPRTTAGGVNLGDAYASDADELVAGA